MTRRKSGRGSAPAPRPTMLRLPATSSQRALIPSDCIRPRRSRPGGHDQQVPVEHHATVRVAMRTSRAQRAAGAGPRGRCRGPGRSLPVGQVRLDRVVHHREPGLADLDLLEAGAPQASRQPQSRRDWTKWEPQAGTRALDEVEFPVAAAPRAADESSARPEQPPCLAQARVGVLERAQRRPASRSSSRSARTR